MKSSIVASITLAATSSVPTASPTGAVANPTGTNYGLLSEGVDPNLILPTDVLSLLPSGYETMTALPSSLMLELEATLAATAFSTAVAEPTAGPTTTLADSAEPNSRISEPKTIPTSEPQIGQKLVIHPYNGPCLAFFSFVGMLLQLPVLLAHAFSKRPNVPIAIMSSWYLYLTLSTFITCVSWTGDDTRKWWGGSVWCDIDTRMTLSGSIGILSTQCVINWNVLCMLHDQPLVINKAQMKRRNIVEACICLFLPVVIIVTETFWTYSRYQLHQYFGCVADIDGGVACLIFYVIWLVILGVISVISVTAIIIRFARRGSTVSFEQISFIPHMTPTQFTRICIFAFVVTVVLAPLSIYLGIFNIIQIAISGVQPMAWIHGKPKDWNVIRRISLAFMRAAALDSQEDLNELLGIDLAVMYINVALAWILFACYGTGSTARSRYRYVLEKVHIMKRRSVQPVVTSKIEVENNFYDDYMGGALDDHLKRELYKWKPELFAEDITANGSADFPRDLSSKPDEKGISESCVVCDSITSETDASSQISSHTSTTRSIEPAAPISTPTETRSPPSGVGSFLNGSFLGAFTRHTS